MLEILAIAWPKRLLVQLTQYEHFVVGMAIYNNTTLDYGGSKNNRVREVFEKHLSGFSDVVA